MARRSLAVAGWLAAAFVATLVGMGAIRLVSDTIASTPGGVRSQEEVARDLAAATPRATSAAPTSSPQPTKADNQLTFAIDGGVVVARCTSSGAEIVTWTANQGYSLDDVDEGPEREVEVKFDGPDGDSEIKIRCDDGRPVRVGHDD